MNFIRNKMLQFIYLPFLANNNVRNQICNFLDKFDEKQLKTFLDIQEGKLGKNEQILLEKEINGIQYIIEYNCFQNLLDLTIKDQILNRTFRLTSLYQIKAHSTTEINLYLPSKLKSKHTKIGGKKIAYFILSETDELAQDYNFCNQNGDNIFKIFNPSSAKVLICALNDKEKFVKNKTTIYKGEGFISDNLKQVVSTICSEEIFEDEEMFSKDFENERFINRDLTTTDDDYMCYEENVIYKNVDKGLYQVIKKSSIGEDLYFGDFVNNDEYFIREYTPYDKGTFNFNSKKSKEIKITKSQVLKIMNDELDIKKLFSKSNNNEKEYL